MKNRGNRAERIEALKRKMSRRDFGRYASLSAIAATMSARARGDVAIDNTDTGCHCINFLNLLDYNKTSNNFYTIEQLLFEPFETLVRRLRDHAENHSTLSHLYTPLDNLYVYVHDTYDTALYLKHLYTHDENVGVPPIGSQPEWVNLHWYVSNPILVRDLSMPFRTLPDRSQSAHRSEIENLLSDAYRQELRLIKYQELFTKSRERLFGDLSNPQNPDRHKYHLVRASFDLFVFKWTPQDPSSCGAGASMVTTPNDECAVYDGNNWSCVPGHEGKYCKLDGGVPTSASDVCE